MVRLGRWGGRWKDDDGRQGHPDNSPWRDEINGVEGYRRPDQPIPTIPIRNVSEVTVGSGCYSTTPVMYKIGDVPDWSSHNTVGLRGGVYQGFTTTSLADVNHTLSEPEIQFPDDKDDINALLPIEDDIKEDYMFLSDDASYQDDMVVSLKNSAEILELQNRNEKARQESQRLEAERIKLQWSSVLEPLDNMDNVNSNKVLIYAQLEKFTGLTELDDEQFQKLKSIVLKVSPDLIRKNKRAADLVKKWLTEEEWKELLYSSKITIYSKKHKNRRYVVHADPMKRVEMFNKNRFFASACGVDSVYEMADGDKFLNKVLALKEDEDGYLAKSNVSKV